MLVNFNGWSVDTVRQYKSETNDDSYTAYIYKDGVHVAKLNKKDEVVWLSKELEDSLATQLEDDAVNATRGEEGFYEGYMMILWLIRTKLTERHLQRIKQPGIIDLSVEIYDLSNQVTLELNYSETDMGEVDEEGNVYLGLVQEALESIGHHLYNISNYHLWVLDAEGNVNNYFFS